LKAYLDNDIVSAIAKRDHDGEISALDRLLKAMDQGRVELVTSELTLQEIKHYQGPKRPPVEEVYQRLAGVPVVRWDELVGISSHGDALTWINSPVILTATDYGALLALGVKTVDARHIFVAAKNACDVFLTCDGGVLHRAAGIAKLFRLVVQKPSAFVASQAL
jgi:hypothetical protein